MTNIIVGIMNAMARFVNSCVRYSAVLALSKRSSSYCCRSNARTTDKPVSISRDTKFTRSISFCIILNFGMATAMSMPIMMAITTTASTMIQLIETFVCETMTIPPMARIGEYSTMRRSITITIWICWISLVPRVMREAAENDWTSASEKEITFSKRRSRKPRAVFAAVRDAMKPTAIEAIIINAATPSI